MNLNNNKYYNKWFINSWPYIAGAVLLSLLQIVTLAVTGKPWRVSSAMAYWGAWILNSFELDVSHWTYFNIEGGQEIFKGGFLLDPHSIRNLGIIVGALFSSLMASQFRIRKVKSKKQFLLAAIGGLLMGYGARIAQGCNIGGLFSSIASLSLSGWIFGFAVVIGAIIGSRIIVRFLI